MQRDDRNHDIGRAASAVLVSLMQTLVRKKVLSDAEVRALLTKAANEITPHDYASPAKGAEGVILDDLLPLFAEDGGN